MGNRENLKNLFRIRWRISLLRSGDFLAGPSRLRRRGNISKVDVRIEDTTISNLYITIIVASYVYLIRFQWRIKKRFFNESNTIRRLFALFISGKINFFPNRDRYEIGTEIEVIKPIEFENEPVQSSYIYYLQGKRFLLLMQLRFRADKPLQTSALRCLQRGSLFRGRTVRFRTGETFLFKLMVPDTQNPWELLQGFRGGQNITAPCNSRNTSLMKKKKENLTRIVLANVWTGQVE